MTAIASSTGSARPVWPSLLNAFFAALIGYGLVGPWGLALGPAAFIGVLGLVRGASWLRRAHAAHRDDKAHWTFEALLAVGKLLLAPFALIAAVATGLLIVVSVLALTLWKRIADCLPAQTAAPAAQPAKGIAASGPRRSVPSDTRRFSDPDNLALLLANIIMLLVIGCLLIGMDVAYYAAVLATPVWLLVLLMMAIDGSVPDQGAPLPDDTAH